MELINFIEKYCLIKDKDNNMHPIKLNDYQIKFIKWHEQTKRKTKNGTIDWKVFGSKRYSII